MAPTERLLAPPDSLNSMAAPHLAELRQLRQRYVTLLDQYVNERRTRMRAAGLSETEAGEVVRSTRERWAL